MIQPLLRLDHISRHYQSGDTVVRALDDVSLSIYPGEYVAIMGQSGSGKSTLMNIIGCLDRPTAGAYEVLGRDVSGFGKDELAALRRETFGFVFQRYNLLATSSAEENVELPAIYAGMSRPKRRERALDLLSRLGMRERADHRPSQLSGGQQQRVAIARALVNNPHVILADEPTGALDSRSGQDVMQLLSDLHQEGRTIILITHDEKVAAHAKRVIRIQDGKVLSDTASEETAPPPALVKNDHLDVSAQTSAEGREAVITALRALRVNIFRTALTLLGIVIGVAAVITMLGVGNGSKQKVLTQISAMGTNILSIRPGAAGIRSSGDIATLTLEDMQAILPMKNVEVAYGERQSRKTLRAGNLDYATSIYGVNPSFIIARDWPVESGTFFTEKDISSYSPVLVLGQTVVKTLFPGGEDPVGKYVLVGNIPFEVIGVMSAKGAAPWGQDQDDAVFSPVTTAMIRLTGTTYLNSITVKVIDAEIIDDTVAEITEMLKRRHGVEDFNVRNTASILAMATETQNTLTVLLGAVAAISLLVGGIGVMNIMLVSVTERTREIGIRMATGARMRDIMIQFSAEAAVVCTIGGVLGVAVGLFTGWVISLFGVDILFTVAPALLAFSCAVGTGLLFGYLPARKAARLDPVTALSSE